MKRLFALSAAVALTLSVAVLACGSSEGRGAVATTPEELASQIQSNDEGLRAGIDAWRSAGDPPSTPPPEELMSQAALLQEAVRLLAARPNLAAATIPRLPGALAGEVRQLTAAARKLRKLSHGNRNPNLRTGEPPPLA